MRGRRSSTLEPPPRLHPTKSKSSLSIATTSAGGYRSAKSSLSPSDVDLGDETEGGQSFVTALGTPGREQSFVSAWESGLDGDEDNEEEEEELEGEGERGYYEGDDEGYESGGDELAYLQSNSSYLSDTSDLPTPQQPSYHFPPPSHSHHLNEPVFQSNSSSLNELGTSSSGSTEGGEGRSFASSTESTTFGLDSPFPRQQVLKVTPSDPKLRNRGSGPLLDEPNRRGGRDKENSPGGIEQGREQQQLQHIRIRAHPSNPGFPYVGSIITAAAATSSSSWISPPNTPSLNPSSPLPQLSTDPSPHANSHPEEPINPKNTPSQRSSSEVDLDISFDLPVGGPSPIEFDTSPSPSPSPPSQRKRINQTSSPTSKGKGKVKAMGRRRRRSLESLSFASSSSSSTTSSKSYGTPQRGLGGEGERGWIGIDMSSLGTGEGTRKKRPKSAIELREAFMRGERDLERRRMGEFEEEEEGEEDLKSREWRREGAQNPMAFAILMDEAGSRVGSPRRVGSDWIRERGLSAEMGAAGREKRRKGVDSLGEGFSFNPTQAVELSPSVEEAHDLTKGKTTRKFPLPLEIVVQNRHHHSDLHPTSSSSQRNSTTTASPSPAWSLTSFFKGPNKETPPTTTSPQYEGMSPITPLTGGTDESVRPRWVDEFAKSTLHYLGSRRREKSPSGPVLVGQMKEYAREEEEDEEERGREQRLLGLGFDFGEEEEGRGRDEVADLMGGARNVRPTHQTIPSLSISPPVGNDGDADADDEDGDNESTSGDSAMDPTVSPSRRLSRSLSPTSRHSHSSSLTRTQLNHRTSVTFKPAPTPPRRPNFGAPPRNLLYSETMPGARLPHEAPLNSTRFSFTPAPLSLVQVQAFKSTTALVMENKSRNVRRRRSISSFTDIVLQYPASVYLDEILPAKILFTLGFFLGPWCWVLGGWWVRPLDGELYTAHGTRCRREVNPLCGCGNVVGWVNRSCRRRHGEFEKELGSEGELDGWVRWNRVAAGVSGGVVMAAFVVALWAVVTL